MLMQHRLAHELRRLRPLLLRHERVHRVVRPEVQRPQETDEGRSARANVGAESKGVRSGVERHRGVPGSKPRGGKRERTSKLLKDRRSPRGRGRVGTSLV